ncbi:MAG: hypothetical protein AAB225_00580, partial [Acidobacteriota bacterium]
YQALAPAVQAVFALTEDWQMKRQQTYEAKALRLIETGRTAEAVNALQQFVGENCARVEGEYKMLNRGLPETLKTVGIKYLFLDYLREWTAKKGVPLPVE